MAATLPLVLQHGSAVSTRMIALAAGVAEGTIFRAFPDKESLLDAVVEKAFDPAPTERALAEIDPALPFEQRLRAAVEILQRRVTDIWRVASTVGVHTVPAHRHTPSDLVGLVTLFASERGAIDRDPVLAARMLRGLTLAFSHPTLVPDGPMTPDEIVSLLMDGIRARPKES